jgi:uncharacterized protein (DUF433 family)
METVKKALAIAPISALLRHDLGGTVRAGPTRVTLDTVIGAYNQGLAPEEIVNHYPSLALAVVYLTVGYYLQHRTEVDAYLEWRRVEVEEIRREVERRWNPSGGKERLLARRAALQSGKRDQPGDG